MKIRFVVICIFIFGITLFFLQIQPARSANQWYVANGGDDSNSCDASYSPCASIDRAIAKASSGDEILIAEGTYTKLTSSGNDVVSVDKSLSLSGG